MNRYGFSWISYFRIVVVLVMPQSRNLLVVLLSNSFDVVATLSSWSFHLFAISSRWSLPISVLLKLHVQIEMSLTERHVIFN